MISNSERREVAARLRNNLVYMRDNREFYENDLDVVKCGNRAYRNIANSVERFANFEHGNYIHICETLSDLIDRPTCEDIGDFDHEAFKCSRCGHRVLSLRGIANGSPSDAVLVTPDGLITEFAYCPNCGAEVV